MKRCLFSRNESTTQLPWLLFNIQPKTLFVLRLCTLIQPSGSSIPSCGSDQKLQASSRPGAAGGLSQTCLEVIEHHGCTAANLVSFHPGMGHLEGNFASSDSTDAASGGKGGASASCCTENLKLWKQLRTDTDFMCIA